MQMNEAYGQDAIFQNTLQSSILKARDALIAQQNPDGHWCYDLEADCTIPAEYIIMMHYMDEIDEKVQAELADYIRAGQDPRGGWPLYTGGRQDISCSVKSYMALKLAGDSPDAPHMKKACEAIRSVGGAAGSNVFTLITLALFGQIPWRGVPFMPPELMLMPRWFPIHIYKVAYWARTVMVPLLILCTLKPRAKNPRQVNIRELFVVPPEQVVSYFPIRSQMNRVFLLLENTARAMEPFCPGSIREHAIRKARDWFLERLNGTDGLGAIFPAMVNSYEALACLGYPSDSPEMQTIREALRKLLMTGDRKSCQPCVSPIWDTGLACKALQEEGSELSKSQVRSALDWLATKQLKDEPGDWRFNHPNLQGGGWAFEYNNAYYPDLDDTAVVAWAMYDSGDARYHEAIKRAAAWICGMQSANGGFAAFDSDNTSYYLNEIPFADHGAILDPPTADVSARCATLLARIGWRGSELKACLSYLRHEQEHNGSWFGRWGTNYIYGTWSVLTALEKVNDPQNRLVILRAVNWLKSKQREDGSWGEDCESYFDRETAGTGPCGTSFQTAWAMLGLMAAGQVNSSRELRRGAEYLIRTQRPDGQWEDQIFTAPGFPRIFYLKYHGYSKYFPLWALSRYRNLIQNR